MKKQHTFEEMKSYAIKSFKDGGSSSQEGYPNTGKSAKRMADGSYLVSDTYSVLIINKNESEGYDFNCILPNFKKETNRWIFTFGSTQAQGFWKHNINPMNIMMIVEDEHEGVARQKVFDSIIGRDFCTSYPYNIYANDFKHKYGMVEMSFDEAIKLLEDTK